MPGLRIIGNAELRTMQLVIPERKLCTVGKVLLNTVQVSLLMPCVFFAVIC